MIQNTTKLNKTKHNNTQYNSNLKIFITHAYKHNSNMRSTFGSDGFQISEYGVNFHTSRIHRTNVTLCKFKFQF